MHWQYLVWELPPSLRQTEWRKQCALLELVGGCEWRHCLTTPPPRTLDNYTFNINKSFQRAYKHKTSLPYFIAPFKYTWERVYSSIIIGSSSCSSLFSHLSLKSAIEDEFWSSRCLNYHIDVPNMIGLFLSGAPASLVVKNRTKKNFSHKKIRIKS